MASSSETGHAKNIANDFSLNQINTGFGVDYNPSNHLLGLVIMAAQYVDCNTKQGVVNTQNGIFKPFVNARHIEFKTVKSLVRQIRSAAKSCGASAEWLKNLNTIVLKILGERASQATPTTADPSGTSASQQSFDNTTNSFQAMLGLLAGQPLYAPNEADLTVVALTSKYNFMNTANNAVKTGAVPYNTAVIARNRALYTITTGLCDVGQNSKEYIRSAFGYSSPEFKLVSKLKFVHLAKVD